MASRIHIVRVCDLSPSTLGEIVTFDARVHRVIMPEHRDPNVLILRADGHYVTALLGKKVVDAMMNEPISTARLSVESLVRVSGLVEPNVSSINSDPTISTALVVQVSKLTVLSRAKENLLSWVASRGAVPGDLSALTALSAGRLSERLDHRVLDARVAETGAIFKLFSGVYALAVEYLTARHFHWIPTPKLINYKIPGDDDYFSVPYFADQHAWLTQTGEVHLVMALSADLERVFDLHTVFRREKDVSTRHLTEFTSLEVGFVLKHGWEEILEFAENLIVFIIKSLQERPQYKALLHFASERYPLANKFNLGLDKGGHFIRVTFSQAKKTLRETLGLETDPQADFTREEETALGRYLAGPYSSFGPPTDLFVITHYPSNVRPFNYHPSEDNPDITNSFDIIIRGQEASTGLHLIHSYEDLRDLMVTRNPPMDPDSPMWRPFVTAYEAGLPPMGGFGMGLNRFVQSFLGLSDIHETVLFPRDASRLGP